MDGRLFQAACKKAKPLAALSFSISCLVRKRKFNALSNALLKHRSGSALRLFKLRAPSGRACPALVEERVGRRVLDYGGPQAPARPPTGGDVCSCASALELREDAAGASARPSASLQGRLRVGFFKSHACTHRKAAEKVISLSSCGGSNNKRKQEGKKTRVWDLFFPVSERQCRSGPQRRGPTRNPSQGQRARSLAERAVGKEVEVLVATCWRRRADRAELVTAPQTTLPVDTPPLVAVKVQSSGLAEAAPVWSAWRP